MEARSARVLVPLALVVALLLLYALSYLAWREGHAMTEYEYLGRGDNTRAHVLYVSVNERAEVVLLFFSPMLWLDDRITGIGTVSE